MQKPVFGQIAVDQRVAFEEKMPMQEVSAQRQSEQSEDEEIQFVAGKQAAKLLSL